MKWVWPFSWYFRIRELEQQLAQQRYWASEMEKRLLAQNLTEIVMAQSYAASLAALASSLERK